MKIAIASEGKDINSQLSQQGGRAPYYLVFEDNKLIEVIKNPFALGSGGTGYSVAHMLAEKKVSIFIAEQIGDNMETALNNKNIKFIEKDGTKNISEILNEQFS